jgi:hypothetical protein
VVVAASLFMVFSLKKERPAKRLVVATVERGCRPECDLRHSVVVRV